MSIHTVRQGGINIIKEQGDSLSARSLGATLAICLSDTSAKISAMAIFLIPALPQGMSHPEEMPASAVTTGLPLLFRKFVEAGASTSSMKIWFAGCGRFMESTSELDIGLKLYSVAKKIIEKNGLKINGEHVGGPLNRSVTLTCGAENVKVYLSDNTEVTI